jgi:predicted membrane-bound spermidine synthase
MLTLAVVLFGPPLVLLGMVGPLAIRLSARSLEEVGRVAGNVFAVSTLASVVAALATGFWLIPMLGVRGLTILVGAAVLFAAGIALYSGRRGAERVIGLVLAIGALLLVPRHAARTEASALVTRGETRAFVESSYAELRVVDTGGLRYLLIDGGAHTVEMLENELSRHPLCRRRLGAAGRVRAARTRVDHRAGRRVAGQALPARRAGRWTRSRSTRP